MLNKQSKIADTLGPPMSLRTLSRPSQVPAARLSISEPGGSFPTIPTWGHTPAEELAPLSIPSPQPSSNNDCSSPWNRIILRYVFCIKSHIFLGNKLLSLPKYTFPWLLLLPIVLPHYPSSIACISHRNYCFSVSVSGHIQTKTCRVGTGRPALFATVADAGQDE